MVGVLLVRLVTWERTRQGVVVAGVVWVGLVRSGSVLIDYVQYRKHTDEVLAPPKIMCLDTHDSRVLGRILECEEIKEENGEIREVFWGSGDD